MTLMNDYEDVEYVKTNREKRQAPKSGEWWCDTCDAAVVRLGGKCKTCGHIQGDMKKVILKKETDS